MIRIGMIGADSTHTEAWTQLVNPADSPLHGRAQVVKLWGEDGEQAQAKAKEWQIPEVVGTPAEALTDVDLAMVVNRYGEDHPPHARLAIEAGLPTFVDKPFANEMGDVHSLVRLAAERDVPLMSCSALRYAGEVMELQERMEGFGALNCAVVSGAAAGDFLIHGRCIRSSMAFTLLNCCIRCWGAARRRLRRGERSDAISVLCTMRTGGRGWSICCTRRPACIMARCTARRVGARPIL